MKTALFILVMVLAAAGGYGYYRNPAGCQKLGQDVVADARAIYTPDSATNAAPAVPGALPVVGPSPASGSAPALPTVAPAASGSLPVAEPATAGAAPTPGPAPAVVHYSVGYVASAPAPPAPAPGSALAPAPASAAGAPARQRNLSTYTDYDAALAAARQKQVPLLILFTGSDWCPYCQKLEQEVLNTPEFNNYASNHFVFLTIDDLRNSPVSDNDKKRISDLEHKFPVQGFPTLMIVDNDEKVKGVSSGYDPGSGPATVINALMDIESK